MSLILHEDAVSGNCYKIRLTASHVGVALERRQYDVVKGQTRTSQFLSQVDAGGKIPVLQHGDHFIPESNAACFYLADGTDLIPEGRLDRANMLRWMFWEQYSHEPNIATLRFWLRFVGLDALVDAQRLQIPAKRLAGEAALQRMEDHLDRHRWLAADRFTIADICLFAYTHLADEADFDLPLYPAVVNWMERIMLMPNHVAMDA